MTLLDAAAIQRALTTDRYGRSIDVRHVTTSTNDDARAAAEAGAPDGHVVVADRQTDGRGAHGRVWDSPGGTDLYVSIVARTSLAPALVPPMTLAVGLAVAETVETLTRGVPAAVKWPNDVWLQGKKCAGILLESSTTGATVDAVVIGIGLDVNRRAWDPSLASRATSVAEVIGEDVDRHRALAVLLAAVERWVDRYVALGPAAITDALRPRLALRGQRVRVDDVEGVLVDVAPSGALRLQTASGVRDVVAGTLIAAD